MRLCVVVIAVLIAAPAEAAPSLKERAAKLLRFLPRPLAGWSKVEEAVVGESGPFTRELSARRRYRKGKAVEEILEMGMRRDRLLKKQGVPAVA